MLFPHIVSPARITSHSSTLIDNIFSNLSKNSISQFKSNNFRSFTTISHCTPYFFKCVPNRDTNKIERDWLRSNHEEFILDYISVDWPQTLKLQNNNVNASFQNFFDSLNNILDIHAPFKKVTKHKIKLRTKPWITSALQESISIKNTIFKNHIKKKDKSQKNELHLNYKIYRNLISALMKRSK